MDRLLVPSVEVLVETVDQEGVDLTFTFGELSGGHRFVASWISHLKVPRIISADPDEYKRVLRAVW